jgi:hypothetical protein
MKRARLGAIAGSALVIAGLAAGGPALSGSASAQAAPSASSAQMVVFDCPGQPAMVRPRDFIQTCADAGISYERLAWTSWTPRLASASGVLEENDCTPNCAEGHFRTYPALIVLWGSTAVPGHPGEHCYTRLTVILTGARPRYHNGPAPMTQTIRLATS